MTSRRGALKLALGGGLAALGGCSSKGEPSGQSRRTIRLWVAPNDAEEAFWNVAVARWNASGKGLPVSFTTIPTAGNSEDTILSALVSGTEPDISTNVFSGFAVQLANLGQVVDLSAIAGYRELVAIRQMGAIMRSWSVNGRIYALPIYSSPTLIWWRDDILRKYGFSEPPRTYDDVYRFSARYAAGEKRYGMQVMAGRTWPDRWFDFISYYYAASGGEGYLDQADALYDNAAGKQVAGFMNRMFAEHWTSPDFDSDDPLVTGLAAGAVRGPWDLTHFRQMYPDALKNIVVGPMLAEAEQPGKTTTFTDSKGIVLFKSSKVKSEAFAFIAWALGDEDLNLLWIEKTGSPPARGDLLTNPRFARHYADNPIERAYAQYVEVAFPPALTEYTIDVQKIMTVALVEPLSTGHAAPAAALADAVARTNAFLALQQ